jgi:hypothetical protein
VANYSSLNGTVSVLLGQGNGSFLPAQTLPAGSLPQSVAVGDFNGDGIPDLAVANSDSNTVSVLLGNGDGTFQTANVSYVAGAGPSALAAADFNGDGRPDLAVANSGSNDVSILLNDGSWGGVSPAASHGPTRREPLATPPAASLAPAILPSAFVVAEPPARLWSVWPPPGEAATGWTSPAETAPLLLPPPPGADAADRVLAAQARATETAAWPDWLPDAGLDGLGQDFDGLAPPSGTDGRAQVF